MSNPSSVSPTDLDLVTLDVPRAGVPEIITTAAELDACCAALAAATGPVALDTERAAGFKYHPRAYLVQIRREGAGTFLIDPTCFASLAPVQSALLDAEWILHAADQDLPCLALEGMRPTRLWDTALAARLLGFERIGLGPLLEDEFAIHLAKEHSAADWSIRPLPTSYLAYAALDVELLIELRERQFEQLTQAGKLAWAEEEFEHLRLAPPTPAKLDPWRSVPKAHTIKDPRGLAILRELWTTRDELASAVDLTPGRIIPHHSLVAMAEQQVRTAEDVLSLKACRNSRVRENLDFIVDALDRAWQLPADELPAKRGPASPGSVGDPKLWRRKDPLATDLYDALRATVLRRAEELRVPQELLLRPADQRRVAWYAYEHYRRRAATPTAAEVAELIGRCGGRGWQAAQTAAEIAQALSEAAHS